LKMSTFIEFITFTGAVFLVGVVGAIVAFIIGYMFTRGAILARINMLIKFKQRREGGEEDGNKTTAERE
jgi:hypothetical protein